MRRIAAAYMRRERRDHTLQPTALVNEAYLRLSKERNVQWEDRGHFFGIAARLMRQILVDHARKRRARKRGMGVRADRAVLTLEDPASVQDIDVLTLHDALTELAVLDQEAELVELRYFGGLTESEVASIKTLSPATISPGDRRGQRLARAPHARTAVKEPARTRADTFEDSSPLFALIASTVASMARVLQDGDRLGPYEIVSPLGAGGMSEVYRGRDTRLDRPVAIKVVSSALAGAPDLRERFDREARAISSLSHPHICPLFDVGNQDGVDFLVMEYLEGETLASRLQRGALPLTRRRAGHPDTAPSTLPIARCRPP